MELRYRLLILDHDDTTVRSSPDIHYPIFRKSMETLRPGEEILSLEGFMHVCFYPGLMYYYTHELGMTREELKLEEEMWKKIVQETDPSFFEGIPEILADFRKAGGFIAVSSQNHSENIIRNYKAKAGLVPDLVYGYDIGDDKTKPNPFSVFDACEKTGCRPEDTIVVDDLKTGFEMAKAAGVDFAAAGWSHFVPEIGKMMRELSKVYLETTDDLRKLLFKCN